MDALMIKLICHFLREFNYNVEDPLETRNIKFPMSMFLLWKIHFKGWLNRAIMEELEDEELEELKGESQWEIIFKKCAFHMLSIA